MKKNYLFNALFLMLCLSACTSGKDDENQQLQQEVIAVHDQVMPLMGTFVRNEMLIDSLLTHMKALKNADASLDTTSQKEKLTSLKIKLESAGDEMNQWMHGLNLRFEGMSDQEVKSYLEEEKSKVEEIARQFEEANAESQEILAPYQS